MEPVEFIQALHRILSSPDWNGVSGIIAIVSVIFAYKAITRSRQISPPIISRQRKWGLNAWRSTLFSLLLFFHIRRKQLPSNIIKLRRRRPQVRIATFIALFALLLAAIVLSIQLDYQMTSFGRQLTIRSSQFATARAEINALQPTIYTLKGIATDRSAYGRLIYLPEQKLTVLTVKGLSHPWGTQVYQGWLLHLQGTSFTDITSIGILNSVDGTATLSFPGNITGYDAVVISLEAGPTATPYTPKGSVVALGSL